MFTNHFNYNGGAGGAVYYISSYTFNPGTYNIIVGSGGNGDLSYTADSTYAIDGTSSSISYNNVTLFTANGGKCGQIISGNSISGGSTSANIDGVVTNYNGGNPINVSAGPLSEPDNGGGGAGAGQNGKTATFTGNFYNENITYVQTPDGGDGYNSSITGVSLYYAGGGAGGNGGNYPINISKNGLGQNNYGGGGQGVDNYNVYDFTPGSQNGKNGCVIIAFTF